MSTGDTKYADLNTNLTAVGKAVFANFYYDFKDASLSDQELALKIYTQNPSSKSASQNFRIPRARHIFKSGQQLDALRIIIQSERVDPTARETAKHILEQEQHHDQLSRETCEERLFIEKLNKDIVYTIDKQTAPFEYDNSPRPPKVSRTSTSLQYHRDRNVSENALRLASYLCEADNSHYVFRRKNGSTNYTEPHHLVPLSAREDFPGVDLDREQNIVSLCSNCHNLLHYGADIDTLLRKLYEERKELLLAIGIKISFEELRAYY